MRLFFEIARRSFQRALTYRAATLAGMVTNLFFGVIRASVLIALYGEADSVNGLSLQGAVTYAALSQAIIAYLNIFGWFGLMMNVHSGDVAQDLLKPMSFYRFWLAQDFGRAWANLLLRSLSIMLIYSLFWSLAYPQSLEQWFYMLISLLLSWWLNFSWQFLVNLTAFWVPNARGIGRFAFFLSMALSGLYMPIRLFPEWLQKICYFSPFPHILNSPLEIYLGVVQGQESLVLIAMQAIWIVLLIILIHVILRLGLRRLVILGG
ncbi:MAG: ABC-2 family transporter protein [Deinococcales bacterium]